MEYVKMRGLASVALMMSSLVLTAGNGTSNIIGDIDTQRLHCVAF